MSHLSPLRPHCPSRPAALAGALAGAVLLLAGCSGPEPVETPAPIPSAGVTSASPTASPTASSTASPTPSTSGSSARPTGAAPSGSSSSTTAPPSGEASVEPSRPVETAPPKRLDQPTRTAGAEVSLVSVRSATIKASTPGDSSGPGVVVRLEVENTTGKTLDTGFVQVNVTNAAGDPGTAVVGKPTDPLGGSIRQGASGRGSYAFLLDDARSGDITVSVYVTSGQPVVQFRGQVG